MARNTMSTQVIRKQICRYSRKKVEGVNKFGIQATQNDAPNDVVKLNDTSFK